jgi:hypothetical protein
MPQSGEKTHFGFQQVALGDKQARVDDVFIASRGATTS